MANNKPCISNNIQREWQNRIRLVSLCLNTPVQLIVAPVSKQGISLEKSNELAEIHWPDGDTYGFLYTSIQTDQSHLLQTLSEQMEEDLKTVYEEAVKSETVAIDSDKGLQKVLQISLEANNEGVLVLDAKGQIIHLNNRLIRMWNLATLVKENASPEQLSKYVESQLINTSLVLKGYSKNLERFGKEKQTDTLFLKDGRIIKRISLPIIEQEQLIGRVFSYRDTTPEHQTKQELREKTNILDTIFDQAPIIMMLVDDRGRIEKVNKPGIELGHFGTDSGVVGQLIGDILHCVNAYPNICGTSAACNHCAIRQTLNQTILTGTGQHKIEGTMHIHNGPETVIHYILVSSASIQTSVGEKYLLSIDDITERHLAKKSLMESEDRFRTLFEYTPIAYQSLDKNGCFLDINNEWSKLTGYNREETIGLLFGEIFSAESKEAFPKQFSQFALEGFIDDLELTLEHKNGELITVLVTGRVQYDAQGNYLRSHCILLDFTERKQIQKELIQAKEKAEEATRIKSAFLANMSHEIRTPMNAILGYAEILNQNITEPTQKEYLASMQSSGKILMDLINDVLDFSKIDAGKMELKQNVIDIRQLFKEILDMFQMKVSQKGLKLLNHISEQIPQLLILDELRLRQILLNLISNALKFTDKGYIRVEVLAQSQNHNTVALHLRVEDTGIGIAKDAQAKIFEAFEQADNQDSKAHGGTGLGLAITYRLVKLMGGDIQVKSTIHQGSTFTIILPEVTVVENDEKYYSSTTTALGEYLTPGADIMIIDDNRANRQVTKGFFAGLQAKITEVENGEEALNILRRTTPQLILIDLRMPGMGGFETAQIIKSNPKLKDIPLIAYTASELTDHEKELFSKLFSTLIRKPIQRKKFLQMVYDCLNQNNNAAGSHNNLTNEVVSLLSDNSGKELIQKWKSLQKIRPRKTMKEFIEQIQITAEAIDHLAMLEYADELEQAFQSFNIEKEEVLFHAFPEIIEKQIQKNHE